MKKLKKIAEIGAICGTLLLATSYGYADEDYNISPRLVSDNEVLLDKLLVESTGRRTRNFTLAEGQDTIVIELDETTNPYAEYSVCLYCHADDSMESYYAFRYKGPIKTEQFKITGLKSGKYYVRITPSSNLQIVTGRVYAAKEADLK